MKQRTNIGLNNYEKFFFRKVFGTNIKRLNAFRKAVRKRQSYHGDSYSTEYFSVKGGKILKIYVSVKKIDAYINSLQKKTDCDLENTQSIRK